MIYILLSIFFFLLIYFGGVLPQHFIPAFITINLLLFFKLFREKEIKLTLEKKFFIIVLAITLLFLYSFFFTIYIYNSIISLLFMITFVSLFLIFKRNFKGKELNFWVNFINFFIFLAILESISGFLFEFFSVKTFLGYTFPENLPGLHGTFVNRNSFSAFLECVMPFSLWGFIFKKDKLTRIIYFIIFFFIYSSIFLSLSRGGIISGTISIFIFLILTLKLENKKDYKNFLLLFISLFVIFFLSLPNLLNRLLSSIFQIKTSGGDIKRILIWKGSIDAIKKNPIHGSGPGNFSIIFTHFRPSGLNGAPNFAHNELLHFSVEYGIPFLILFLSLAFYIFFLLYRGFLSSLREEKKGLYIATFSSFSAIFIHSFVDFPLHIPVISLTIFTLFTLALINFKWNYFKKPAKKITFKIKGGKRIAINIFLFLSIILMTSILISNTYLIKGKKSLEMGNLKNGMEFLKTSSTFNPLNSEIYFEISKAFEKNTFYGLNRVKNYEKCIKYLLIAIKKNPEKGFYRVKLAEVVDSFFRLEENYFRFFKFEGNPENILKILNKFFKKNFKDHNSLINFLYLSANKYDKNNFLLLDFWALHLMKTGEIKKAKSLIEKSFKSEPELSKHAIFNESFLIKYFREKIKKALLYNISKKRYFKDSLIFLCKILIKEKKLKDALAQTVNYLKIFPQDTDIIFLEGKILLKMGRERESFEILKKYIKLSGDNFDSFKMVFDEIAGERGVKKALNFFEIENKYLLEENPETYLYISKFFYAKGNYDSAIKFLKKYLRKNKENGKAYFYMGNLLLQRGKYVESAKYYILAMNKGFLSEKLFLNISDIFLKINNPGLARKYLEIGLKKFPESVKIKNRIKQIK